MFYILENGKPKILNLDDPKDQLAWFTAFKDENARRVDSTDLTNFDNYPGGRYLSTVFLGNDHNWSGKGPPILFETMIFGGKHDNFKCRYCTLEEAQVGHQIIVRSLWSGIDLDLSQIGDSEWIKKFFEMYTGE